MCVCVCAHCIDSRRLVWSLLVGKVPADLFAGSITDEQEGNHHW